MVSAASQRSDFIEADFASASTTVTSSSEEASSPAFLACWASSYRSAASSQDTQAIGILLADFDAPQETSSLPECHCDTVKLSSHWKIFAITVSLDDSQKDGLRAYLS